MKKTILGKVVSGITNKSVIYGRFYIGRPVSNADIECANRYNLSTLSTNAMKHGYYSVVAFS